jgi:2'-5' RNA ligase
LTLARVKRDATISERTTLSAALAENVPALGDLAVEHVSVMKSELRPSGSVYTCLDTIDLKRGA